jgi:hypothetical protein
MNGRALGRATLSLLTVAVLLAGFLTGLGILKYSPPEEVWEAKETINVNAVVPLDIRNRVEIYKNGELVHEKEGDPWTIGFAKLLTLLLFSTDYPDLTRMSVTAVLQPDRDTTITEVLPGWSRYAQNLYSAVIGIGSSDAPFSVYNVSLGSTISLYDVVDSSNVAFADAGDFFWLNLTGPFTGLDATVREVGLLVRVYSSTSTIQPDQSYLVMLMRDVLTTPITMLPEDLLVVKYVMRIYKDVFVRYGLCDLVQVIFGLGDRNLRGTFPCPRVTTPSSANWGAVYFDVRPGKPLCGTGHGNQFCVRAVLATQSVAYTDRFTVTQIPPGIVKDMTSSDTTITTNSTHLIMRTTFLFPVPVSSTFYGLSLYRYSYSSSLTTVATTVTLTAFTTHTLVVDAVRTGLSGSVSESYLLMFIPFAEPITAPEGSRVRVVLELALPIS